MTIRVAAQSITKFGERWDTSLRGLIAEAIEGILKQGFAASDFDAVIVANFNSEVLNSQGHLGPLVAQILGKNIPAWRVEAACASGGVAIHQAVNYLLAESAKTVLVVGAEKMTDASSEQATAALAMAADSELEMGNTFPSLYALLANAHVHRYSTTREMLSAVAVKNHRHALLHPNAQFHKEITLDDVARSPMVATPLRLLDCSPISDGAAAVVLTTKKIKTAPKIIASALATDTLNLSDRASLTSLFASKIAGQKALEQSGLKIRDFQLAEVHDCFTIAELLALEDLGFYETGKAGQATLKGKTTFGQKLVVNPSGGLKGFGHPVGATGIKQIAILSEYLHSGAYQYALAHNVGGSGATAVVHHLEAA